MKKKERNHKEEIESQKNNASKDLESVKLRLKEETDRLKEEIESQKNKYEEEL